MNWIMVVLTCLAVHRVTRVITRDHLPLIAVPRQKITMWLDPAVIVDDELIDPPPRYPLGIFGRSIAFLLECDWCMSIYVSAGIVAVEDVVWHLGWLNTVLLGLAASTVTGLIAQHEPD